MHNFDCTLAQGSDFEYTGYVKYDDEQKHKEYEYEYDDDDFVL